MEKGLIHSFDLSRFGEEEATRFLKKNGFRILERNYWCRTGEIDIVARSHKIVVFVEVKTRSSADYAQPWEAVGFRKQRNLKAAARNYIRHHPLRDCEFRFDVISIVVDWDLQPHIEWIQDAF